MARQKTGRLQGIAIGCLTCVALAACGVEIYGKADRYDQHSRPEFDVVIPPNAPFISEQFVEGGMGGKNHLGIDVWGKRGSMILAAAPGQVVKSYYEPAFGNQIVIDHGADKDGRTILTHYKHLYERMAEPGQTVARGQHIGSMGATGAMGMMVHLHFEVQRVIPGEGTKAFDPNLFWVDGIGRITCYESTRTYPDRPFRTTYPVRCRED